MASYKLGEEALRQVREVVRRVLGEFRNDIQPPQTWGRPKPHFRRGVLTTAVAAGEASEGTVQPQRWDTATEAWVSDGSTIDGRAGVPLDDEIPSDKVVWFWKEYGVWWFLLAEC